MSECLKDINSINDLLELLKRWKQETVQDKLGIIKQGALFSDFLWKTNELNKDSSEEEDEDNYEDLVAASMLDINEKKKNLGDILNVKSIIKNNRNFFRWIFDNITNEFVSFSPMNESIKIDNKIEHYFTRKNDINIIDDMNNKMFLTFAEMILPFELYEQQNVENVISEFIKNWMSWSIYVKTEIAKSGVKKTVYIYNQFQTTQLHKYPYNQWIVDTTDIFHDITITYYNIISKLLETTKARIYIYPLMNLIAACNQCLAIVSRINIKPLINFGKTGYSSIADGIYCSEKTTSIKFDEYDPATSNIFPLRDGWMIWNDDGSFIHSTDNYDKFMPVCLNITYDKDFKMKYSTEYNIIQKCINEVFPVEDEREYILKCISTLLNGRIRKDTLIIQYGGGSDGKTFFSNIILSMLGENACQSNTTDPSVEIIKGRKKR